MKWYNRIFPEPIKHIISFPKLVFVEVGAGDPPVNSLGPLQCQVTRFLPVL